MKAAQAARSSSAPSSSPEGALRSSYTVAVRALCEFTAKQGDLDLRFTPSATALEGHAGQATVAARRGATYRCEIGLAGSFAGRLLVRGRADGYDADRQQLEEVKTFRGDLARMPANRRALHWAQLKVYGALLCGREGLAELTLALVYFDVATQTETVLAERHAGADLQIFFDDLCRRFLTWADQEIAHVGQRDAALAALPFPHAEFRTGQRPLAESVYRAAIAGRPLLAQAPTGIGKTVGTLYPLLRAWHRQRFDKVFFLSAKTPGRAVALQSLALIADHAGDDARGDLPLRVLELVARDKACEHPDKACHGESCPLASGFYDRLPAARAELVATRTPNTPMDRAELRRVALAHHVCPYYLGQEMVRWADVIVADYNHYFDSSALLHGMTVANDWRVGVLVDEAHNLVPRARAMYSATLGCEQLQAVLPTAPSGVKPALARLARCWDDLRRQHLPDGAAYVTCETPPAAWTNALQGVIAAIADHLADAAADPLGLAPPLLRFYFDVLQMSRLCDSFAAHSLFDLTAADADAPTSGSTVCVRNLVPAPFLAPRFAAAQAVVLFSATLAPARFHIDLLGLPAEQTAWVDIESPFAAAQLQVHIASAISTRFERRDASLAPIVALMARQYAQAPGNYLAFLSSFDYQGRVAALLRERHPEIAVWEQSRQMDEAARAGFLERFRVDGCGIGFAVLGGAFAEGIDLAGRRLIGAFIATLGLPQVNLVNEQVKARMEALFAGRGHDYTYLFPGLQRVVQAAGRVIRTPQDSGSVHLIDDRFDRPEVRALLPGWWALPPRSARAGTGRSRASVAAI